MQHAPDLRTRLDRLERDLRHWRWSSVALLLGFLGILAVGFACPSAPTEGMNQVAAERFVLLTAEGEEAGVLDLDAEGRPQLLLRHGQAHAFLSLAGPALQLRGADGRTSAFLGIDDQTSKLQLTSKNLLDGLRASVQADGSAGFYALDKTGRERAALEYLSTGNAQVGVRDGQGKPRGLITLDSLGIASSLLLDEAGRRRIGMMAHPGGTPSLVAEDGEGRPRLHLTVDESGMPAIELLREDGLPMFREPK